MTDRVYFTPPPDDVLQSNEVVLFDSRDHYFTTRDCPIANGRAPQSGEQMWEFHWTIEDGSRLWLRMGRESHDKFREFILREELDDAADAAAERLAP